MVGPTLSLLMTVIDVLNVSVFPAASVAVAVNESVVEPNEYEPNAYAFVKMYCVAVLLERVAPVRVTLDTPRLSLTLTVKVTTSVF